MLHESLHLQHFLTLMQNNSKSSKQFRIELSLQKQKKLKPKTHNHFLTRELRIAPKSSQFLRSV